MSSRGSAQSPPAETPVGNTQSGSSLTPPPPSRPQSRTIVEGSTLTTDDSEQAGFLSMVPMQIAGATPQRYNGRRIVLDLRDADIRDVLRLLAEVGNVNIVASEEVTGTVTIHMSNVPWNQALEVILAARQLGMQQRGNIIRVAPQATLDKEYELRLAHEELERNNALPDTRLIPVSYATASELAPRVKELLSPRGTVSVDERTNVLIVRDLKEYLGPVERLVRSLDSPTPQVLVEARIVEATSTFNRDVGIQWGGDFTAGPQNGNPTGIIFPSSIGLVGGLTDTQTGGLSPISSRVANPNFAVNLPATVAQGGAIGLTLGSIDGNFNINVRLAAAESNNQVRIVSAPRILTLDNREALIAQGTLIPYSQLTAAGVQTAFQEAKLQLRVRPHVTSDGSVSMHVRVTRDEPDFINLGPRGDPTIRKKEAETDLLIADGRTAVIGGIYTRTTGRAVNQVPGLGDIPIFGVLFQRRINRDERTEMLMFLRPRIVNRAEALGR